MAIIPNPDAPLSGCKPDPDMPKKGATFITSDGYVIIEGITYEAVEIKENVVMVKRLRNPEMTATIAIKSKTDFEQIKKLLEFYTNK